jgi:hypothetical protein
MSTVKGLRAGRLAFVMVGLAFAAGTASAQNGFTTERPSSVLIFPKVVNTNPGTVIQITNTNNMLTQAHCFYVNGAFFNGQALWQITDFELVLTRQQPTHWSVADGRSVNPFDNGTPTAGLDPGAIPPVAPGFTGYLLCVEVDASGIPVSSNSLKGEGTVGDITGPGGINGVSKYNAIGIQACVSAQGPCGGGGTANNGDNVVSLDNLEYSACPGGLLLNFAAEGGPDPAIDGSGNTPSLVSTSVTVVPCGADFENLIPPDTTQTIQVRNEFEERGSVTLFPVECWAERTLGDPIFGNEFTIGGLGTLFGSGVLRPLTPNDLPVLGVANVLRVAGDGTSDTAATNLHFCTEEADPSSCVPRNSEIRLPIVP